MGELIIKDVFKTYYKNKQPINAVKSLNLKCNDGEFVALLGPSGCGKSTTLRMIAGLEDITSGDIIIGDRRINDLHPKDRNIGLAFENYAMYPPLTVYENIGFNLKAKKVSSAKVKEEINKIAKLLDIEDLLDMKPGALSGGQKQRVNIARALIRRPEVLLLDEPLSHLDGKVRQRMRTEIKQLHSEIECTTIIVTHDQLEAMALADRIAIINEGVLQQFGTPLEVFNHPVNEFVASFIGEPPMNIFTVISLVESGVPYFKTENNLLKFEVPEKYCPYVKEGEKYRFGIRPTDISISARNEPFTLQTKVNVFENLGEEVRIHIRIEEDNILSVVSNEIYYFESGDPINLLFNPDRIHIFDSVTGERIEKAIQLQ
ncbi:ABC transporter ATP-binding protein [Bacillus sp. REN16]|uniref:ABC transporter ATP-binding protein n=1 Tax=Bacillus sp. REN16 TaxID=2887296 RepID=UPI001E608066|nr:ABC transporter ATP-binding protein [Bacillus sp. REN16]MCC3355923.1 ABC transporter ATP-binding protein [Bacillus sp. REN16]